MSPWKAIYKMHVTYFPIKHLHIICNCFTITAHHICIDHRHKIIAINFLTQFFKLLCCCCQIRCFYCKMFQ